MKKSSLLLLGLSVLTGCHLAEHQEKVAWKRAYQAEQTRAQDEVVRMREALDEAKVKFAERHKRYACAREDVPPMEEYKGPGHRFKSMQFGEHLVLKLRLGKATHADGTPYGPTRTQSRYQLLWDNKLVAEAESLFSTPNSEDTENRFFYNPKSHTLVVFDDLCWSTQRFLVFERSAATDKPSAWTTRYFYVPDPPSTQPFPDMSTILGVGNGNIYMEINGQPYAFPFVDFAVSNLEFTVG